MAVPIKLKNALIVLVLLLSVAVAVSAWQRSRLEQSYRSVGIFVDARDIAALAEVAGLSPERLAGELQEKGVNGLVVPVSQPVEPFVREFRGYMKVPVISLEDEATVSEGVVVLLRGLSAEFDSQFVIFEGEASDGYQADLDLVQSALQSHGAALGRVEFGSIPGETQLAQEMANQIVRVHTITPREMRAYPMGKSVLRFARAARERNYRALWLRFILPDAESGIQTDLPESKLLQANFELVERTVEAVRNEGFIIGAPSMLPPWSNGLWGLLSAAFLAGLVLAVLFSFIGLPMVSAGLLGLLLPVAAVALCFTGRDILARQIVAFGAVNGVSALAITRAGVLVSQRAKNESVGTPTLRATLQLSGIVLIGILGGLVVSAALGDYRFMLKTHQYLGVKLSLLLPVLWVSGFFFFWNGQELRWRPLREMPRTIREAIRPWHFAVGIVLLLLGVLYIGRSANFVLPVSRLELWMREALENLLVARPRTKEFLIGHPLLLLGFYWAYAHRRFGFYTYGCVVVGSISAVSILNTFCHVHTPLYLGILRTVYGYGLGVLLGLTAILATSVLGKLLESRGTARGVPS